MAINATRPANHFEISMGISLSLRGSSRKIFILLLCAVILAGGQPFVPGQKKRPVKNYLSPAGFINYDHSIRKDDGKIIDITDLRMPVAENSATTYADLLRQFESGGEIRLMERLGEILHRNASISHYRLLIEKLRAVSFTVENRACLALIVNLRDLDPINSNEVYSSFLLVYDFSQSRAKLLQKIQFEVWRPAPLSELDFYDAGPIVVLLNGIKRSEAFWVINTTKSPGSIARRYSLFTVERNFPAEILSDLPGLETWRQDDCKYESKENLEEIALLTGPPAKGFPGPPALQTKILEYRRPGNDCAKDTRAAEAELIKTYESKWNGRFYRTELAEIEIPFKVPPAATPKPDEEFRGWLETGKVYRASARYSKTGDGWRLAVPLKQYRNETIKIEWYYKDRSMIEEYKMKPGERRRRITFQIISQKIRRAAGKRQVITYRGFVYPVGEEIPEC